VLPNTVTGEIFTAKSLKKSTQYVMQKSHVRKRPYGLGNKTDVITFFKIKTIHVGAWGSVVGKALRYQLEGLEIEPQWCYWGYFA
jgi:hypothetical protein